MKAAPRLPDYLEHILEAINRIERYTSGLDGETFAQATMIQDAVIRNFEVVGEASRNIRNEHPEFATAHPELELRVSYEMRNALIHGYFNVNLETIWRTIQGDLPRFQAAIKAARYSLE